MLFIVKVVKNIFISWKKKDFIIEIKENISKINQTKVKSAISLLTKQKKNNKIILAGNGASASISSHVSIDLTKAAGLRAINFNEANLLTCFSNDYGYENWTSKALDFYAIPGDVVILVSSSGTSKNITNAAKKAKKMGLKIITLSGFSKKNSLLKLGDINFHVDSKNYNVIESLHLIILLLIVEKIIDAKKNS